MLEAGFWGAVGGIALVVGALLGLFTPASQRVISAVMALGAGILMSSAAFELMEESFRHGGALASGAGLVCGALSYYGANWWLSHRGAHDRKRAKGQQAQSGSTGSASALVVGALLDGIPESVAIGVSLLEPGGKISWVMVVAVFLSNIPESMAASAGMKRDGRPLGHILAIWGVVTVVSALSAALGNLWLARAPGTILGGILAFAAGAVLTMLASTMLPEAYEVEGSLVGMLSSIGFLAAFLLSHFE